MPTRVFERRYQVFEFDLKISINTQNKDSKHKAKQEKNFHNRL
jgi:hypothetical protein